MAKQVYNFTLRVKLFELMLSEFGRFSSLWHPGGYPRGMSMKEVGEKYERVYERFVKVSNLKKPKSHKALWNQVAWATTDQDMFNSKTGQIHSAFKMQRQLRFAAYLAGFMSMSDIVRLEQVVQDKVDSTTKCNYNIDSDREVVDNELAKSE